MKKFYQLVKSEKEEDVVELIIHGDITSYAWTEGDTGSFDLARELSEITASKLKVRINSYGGEVSQGLGIYNLLKSFKGEVTTINDGFACSAAATIFMAGKQRIMPKSSLLMIHNALTYASGDANQLRKIAEILDKVTEPSVQIYFENSNLSEKDIRKKMDDETWITAEEALEYGFATQVIDVEPTQSINDHFLYKLVVRNKELEKQVHEESNLTNKTNKDPWASFFNSKKGK